MYEASTERTYMRGKERRRETRWVGYGGVSVSTERRNARLTLSEHVTKVRGQVDSVDSEEN